MNPNVVGFWYSTFTTVFAGLISLFMPKSGPTIYNFNTAWSVVVVTLFYFMSSYLFNLSMRYISASLSSSLIFLAIPVSQLLDFLVYGKQWNTFEVIGVATIFTVNLVLSIYLARKKQVHGSE